MKKSTVEKIVVGAAGIAFTALEGAYWYLTGREDENAYFNKILMEAAAKEKSEKTE